MHRVVRQPSTLLVSAIALLIFFIPTNLFAKLLYPGAMVSGVTIDYLLPKLYLSDLAVFLVLLLSWKSWSKRMLHMLFVFALFAFLHLYAHRFNPALPSIAWMVLKWFEFLALSLVLIEQKEVIKHPWITRAIALTIMFQTLLGGYQYVTQHSFAGFKFFGEPNFSQAAILVKSELPGSLNILPYGTTPHPNVLAGVVVLLFLMLMTRAPKSLFTQLCGVCALLITLATQSTVALCVLFFGFILSVFSIDVQKKIKTKTWTVLAVSALIVIGVPFVVQFLTTQFPQSPSLTRRAQFNEMGLQAFLTQPFAGVGVNAFTAVEHLYGEVVSTTRFTQPTHHVPLLFLAETGMFGVIFLITFCVIVHKYYSVVFSSFLVFIFPIMFILSLDHYMYTLQQGQLLFVFILVLVLKKRENITSSRAKKSLTS